VSDIKARALAFVEECYIDGGYMYSGCVHANEVRGPARLGITNQEWWETLWALVETGALAERECDAVAFELPARRRVELIREHDLHYRWCTDPGKGAVFYPMEYHGEIQSALRETGEVSA
jgi:hypothetical protein